MSLLVPAPPLNTAALAFLEGLGTEADEVAAALERLGAVGRRKIYCACPIAVALLVAFPDIDYVKVTRDGIYAWNRDEWPIISMAAPPAIDAFVGAFDSGAYPHLADGDDR